PRVGTPARARSMTATGTGWKSGTRPAAPGPPPGLAPAARDRRPTARPQGVCMSTVVVFEAFGGPESLRVQDETVAAPGPGQVRVANRVVGVNPADVKRLAGAFGGRVPGVLGFEAAGVVDAVGPDVPDLAPGDEVVWHGTGAQRELSLVRADHVRRTPASVAPEQAAVLPVAAAAGRSAPVLGARVVGTAAPANHDYLRGLGATPVAYGPGLVDAVRALPDGLDEVSVVVDLVGTPETVAATVALLGEALAPASPDDPPSAVTIVGSQESRAAGIVDKVDAKGALDEVLALAEDGRLRAEISARYPLAEAASALRR